MRKYIAVFVVAALGAVAGVSVLGAFQKRVLYGNNENPAILSLANTGGSAVLASPDFIQASALALPAVVHVKSYFEKPQAGGSAQPWFDWFNPPPMERQAAGSGVIISRDGYIATNNHVVKDADRVQVTLYDKRTFDATVIGTDPTTDLALLKIDQSDLQFLPYGNSDQVAVGEWVLAVGNPFNLTSTVTAGIVSAKGRSLNILDSDFKIESFIQTDAAVNPGNSGGALINAKGEVVGINTAIASQSGRYEGYSFAIPSNLVKKVIQDLKEHGKVQRGIIGVNIRDIDAEFAGKAGLENLNGVYVNGIIAGGAAESAGIHSGDVITAVNGTDVKSSAELQEIIGQYRPGDKVEVTISRSGEEQIIPVTLRGIETAIADNLAEAGPADAESFNDELGGSLRPLTLAEKQKLKIENGVKVTEVKSGILSELGIEKGFVITQINGRSVDDAIAAESQLRKSSGQIQIRGIHPDGSKRVYSITR